MKIIKFASLLVALLMTTTMAFSQDKNKGEKPKSVIAPKVGGRTPYDHYKTSSEIDPSPLIDMAISNKLHSTYVTKSMLDFAKGTKVGAMNIEDLKGKIEIVEIYTTLENNTKRGISSSGLRAIAAGSTESKGLSMALNLTLPERGENVAFYTKSHPYEEGKIGDLVMIYSTISTGEKDEDEDEDENGNCTVVRIIGEFSTDDFKKMIGK